MIFDKKARELAKRSIDPVSHSFIAPIGHEYVEALEEIAKAADAYLINSTPINGIKLNDALAVVDRMHE